jgi:hypothetical protein
MARSPRSNDEATRARVTWHAQFLFEPGRAAYIVALVREIRQPKTMNVAWHRQHGMPRRATLEQRIAWHRAHQAACACRPIPAKLLAQLEGPAPKEPKRRAAAEPSSPAQPNPKFARLVATLSKEPGVSFGGKGFGSSALKLDGRIFAMFTAKGQFVAKLSRARVDELVARGQGQYFDPGHGRRMKDWFAAAPDNVRWLPLAREAYVHAKGQ